MSTADIRIRPALKADLPELVRLAALLIRTHHQFDPKRFMAQERERDYPAFLLEQLASADAAIMIAESAGRVVGYIFAAIEPASLKELREEAGYIHDLAVLEDARGRGVAALLMAAAAEWLKSHGVPRVLLWTATENIHAQRLFERLGFRPTMVELTREL
jgi:ribosomal protein S18 acetylase RimI-like enzyme